MHARKHWPARELHSNRKDQEKPVYILNHTRLCDNRTNKPHLCDCRTNELQTCMLRHVARADLIIGHRNTSTRPRPYDSGHQSKKMPRRVDSPDATAALASNRGSSVEHP